ncbi:hypothetical protein [Leuconostoc gasicomitatum]|uniref:hypothetical protein n=1 Tax=Leuconostoc gasicomitatum TaxID=115778 RepID=UPI0007E1D1F2|nr:hypothetical protein [Leuconostoc gasicomitatum]CUW06638.1 hypothetical protein PB1E_0730 [Leuconostoc gasicomitatum]
MQQGHLRHKQLKRSRHEMRVHNDIKFREAVIRNMIDGLNAVGKAAYKSMVDLEIDTYLKFKHPRPLLTE